MRAPSPHPESMPDRGRVLNVQRMSTDDGPGIRTTVFLKGCSLACRWCHNPESIASGAQLTWHEEPCMGCQSCVEACPEGARRWSHAGPTVDAERCCLCGTCADECPTAAIEIAGAPQSVPELLDELVKDRAYFRASGGGVTLSGGEPVLQATFALRLLEACQLAGLHTALDTSGMCNQRALLSLLPTCDLVLYDLKELDDHRHRELTGQSNGLILDNVRALAAYSKGDGADVALWIRTPLVPGATARDDNVRAIGAFIARELGDVVERWELCAFNNLCQDKYRRLGVAWEFASTPLLTDAELDHFARVARSSGVDPSRVHAGGPTRFEQESPST